MRMGLVVPNQGATVDGVAAQLVRAETLGYDSAWMPGIPDGPDSLVLLALAGRATQRIELGPAILPALPRHPAVLAAEALTVNDALGGRLALGTGLSHRKVVESYLGLSFERPAVQMEDYLRILRPLLANQAVDYEGSTRRTRLRLAASSSGLPPPSVHLAALGPRMLRVAGTHADGVMTWMAGTRTVERHVVPLVNAAAEAAGRPAPRVFTSFPVMLTDDVDTARAAAEAELGFYGRLPAYRAVLDLEGVDSPADIALCGDEAALTAALARLRDAGTTDFQLTPFGDEAATTRTIEFLATCAA
jgi:F420-dependent oxidoreductase-like protein